MNPFDQQINPFIGSPVSQPPQQWSVSLPQLQYPQPQISQLGNMLNMPNQAVSFQSPHPYYTNQGPNIDCK